MTLASAVKDLQIELESGENPSEALKFICEEYTLNPTLIARKFQEQYGVSYLEWKASTIVERVHNAVINRENMTPYEIAVDWSKRFNYPLGESVKIGRPFDSKGDKYLFVYSYHRDFIGYIKAVDAETGERIQLRCQLGERFNELLSQIYAPRISSE